MGFLLGTKMNVFMLLLFFVHTDGYEIVEVFNRQDQVVQSAILCITISMVYIALVSAILVTRSVVLSSGTTKT